MKRAWSLDEDDGVLPSVRRLQVGMYDVALIGVRILFSPFLLFSLSQ